MMLGKLTREEALRIQIEATAAGFLVHWTVTTRTSDIGDQFAARAHFIGKEGGKSVHKVSASALVADSLAELRRKLPPGLFRLDRDRSDDPVIVETWV